MQKVKTIAVALCLFAAFSGSASAQEKSLYDRLGGKAAIDAVIEDFVGRVAADTRINQKFAKSNIPRVKQMLKDQVCEVSGGPCKYTGLDMKTAHKNMKVTEGEFNALVDDLVATLDKFNVPEKEKSEVLGALGGLRSLIVEDSASATGTGLPTTFKPAPPLTGGHQMGHSMSGSAPKTQKVAARKQAGGAKGGSQTVAINDFNFAPKAITVKVGTTVTWDNRQGTHTVNADNGSFESPTLTAGKKFSYKFTKPGTYRYYCSFHGGRGGSEMSGVVKVTK